MKKILILLLLPVFGYSQTPTNIANVPIYLGTLDSAKVLGSINGLTKNFWGIDLIKKAVKYTDTSGMLAAYTRTGISYTKSQADARYLQSYSETDPVFVAHVAHSITSTNITNWNTAFGWGNHASAGYLTSSALTPYLTSATAASTYQPLGSYVPTARTITINGTTLDLSANRSWTIATNVGSVAWGSITGTLSGQTDLQSALNAKQSTITTGTTAQYFRGDLSLATFPTIPAQFNPIAGTNMTITGAYPNLTFNSTATGTLSTTNFVFGETPSGTINGSNVTFTIANTPVTGKEVLYLNGIRQKRTTDYTISGATITFITAPSTGDELLSDYLK